MSKFYDFGLGPNLLYSFGGRLLTLDTSKIYRTGLPTYVMRL